MLWQMLSSFHPYNWAKGKELHTSKENLLFWGASIVSFFWSDAIKLAHCQKKFELAEAPHVINANHNKYGGMKMYHFMNNYHQIAFHYLSGI
jgi:hypothetical protein